MAYYSHRQGARHLLLLTRLAEVTKASRWVALRDRLLNLWMQSTDWDARGMYFVGNYSTDQWFGAGAYDAGTRVASPWQIAILAEALAEAYRTTGRVEVRERLVAMARYVATYGIDPVEGYTGDIVGFQQGKAFWPLTASPSYTTSLVNLLVYGYKFTGDHSLLVKAQYAFGRGTRGAYGYPRPPRTACDTCVGHFIDTQFASSTNYLYFDHNKGELQYTYRLFENGGLPTIEPGSIPLPPCCCAPSKTSRRNCSCSGVCGSTQIPCWSAAAPAARIRRHTNTRRLDGNEGSCGMNTSQVCTMLPPLLLAP